tara:strand:- start:8 stop:136 length:129 start_codon:yes stop_codon:yes gene_type:complete
MKKKNKNIQFMVIQQSIDFVVYKKDGYKILSQKCLNIVGWYI